MSNERYSRPLRRSDLTPAELVQLKADSRTVRPVAAGKEIKLNNSDFTKDFVDRKKGLACRTLALYGVLVTGISIAVYYFMLKGG